MTDQSSENGLNDVFVETAYSTTHIMRAIEAEERQGIRESPCAFEACVNSGRDSCAAKSK